MSEGLLIEIGRLQIVNRGIGRLTGNGTEVLFDGTPLPVRSLTLTIKLNEPIVATIELLPTV